jgi:hypothetical protein
MAKGYREPKAQSVWEWNGRAERFHIRDGHGEGHVFEYTLAVGPYHDLPAEKASIEYYWGAGTKEGYRDPIDESTWEDSLKRRLHVQEISLVLDGQPVQIPKAAYIDLVDLHVGTPGLLRGEGPRYFLYVGGSDAGESYMGKFTIEDYRVTKREIWAGEFPEFGPEVVTFGPDGTASSRTRPNGPSVPQDSRP